MPNKRIHRIEEIDLGDGKIAHRQSVIEFDDDGGIICPSSRFPEDEATAMCAEWSRVMGLLEDNDLDHIVDGIALMDHCKDVALDRDPMIRGKNERQARPNKAERKAARTLRDK